MINHKVLPNGTQIWTKNGRLHRDDGPAAIHPSGTSYWYKDGSRHRSDGPAVIYPDGRQKWWLNGLPADPLVVFVLQHKEST